VAARVIALQGSYRKGKVTDSAVDTVLQGAESAGAETEKVYLIDQHIEFCNNCRSCTQQPGIQRGSCVHQDDMMGIFEKVDKADAVVFSSPINAFSVTAVTKKFIERLLVCYYWPWGKFAAPKSRTIRRTKKAVIITSGTVPAFIGRFLMSGAITMMEGAVSALGAKPIRTLFFGMAAITPDWKLTERDLQKCRRVGSELVVKGALSQSSRSQSCS